MYLIVRVIPNSKKQKYIYDRQGNLKLYLTASPEGGAANAELITALSKWLDIPQRAIAIITGKTSRIKRLSLDTPLTFEQILAKLGVASQLPLPSDHSKR